jgi:hypothetical protein
MTPGLYCHQILYGIKNGWLLKGRWKTCRDGTVTCYINRNLWCRR